MKKFPWLYVNKPLSVDVIYDFSDTEDADDREASAGQDTVNTAKDIQKALTKMGHKVTLVPVQKEIIKETLSSLRGDIVFNQVEEDELGYESLALLEKMDKKVTGVDSRGFKLSWDKKSTKDLLISNGVPTPKYFVTSPKSIIITEDLSYPLFVKAADDHGSLSVTQSSLVNDYDQLINQVKWIKDTIGGKALVEEYIDGRELWVSILGNGKERLLLPIKETLFEGKGFRDKAKILTYEGKWNQDSPEYSGTSTICPAILSPEDEKALKEVINKSCKALNVQDYARFDVRLRDGVAYVIDYNANPGLGASTEASVLPAQKLGLSYPEFISAIVAVALRRYSGRKD